jgi:hypothetical protein
LAPESAGLSIGIAFAHAANQTVMTMAMRRICPAV